MPFESTCVCVSQGFLWEKPDPDSSPANRPALSFFFFFPPSLPHYVLFTPLEAAQLSPSPPPSSPTLSTLPQTRSDLAAACVPTSYRCVYPPCVCLNSPQRELALFGEAKENSNVEDTPPPAAQMDHSAFARNKGMPHIQNLGDVQLHKILL